MSRLVPVVLASTLLFTPPGANGADLVVWWFKGFYEQEDAAVREIIAAFEQETGKEVELVQPAMDQMFDQANAALEAGSPPDSCTLSPADNDCQVGLRRPPGRS